MKNYLLCQFDLYLGNLSDRPAKANARTMGECSLPAPAGAVPRHCGRQALATHGPKSWSLQEGRLPLRCVRCPALPRAVTHRCSSQLLGHKRTPPAPQSDHNGTVLRTAGDLLMVPRRGAGCLAARGLDSAQLFSMCSKHCVWKGVGRNSC